MTASKLLFCLCVSFIVGIAVSSLIHIPQGYILGFLMLAILLVITLMVMCHYRRSSLMAHPQNTVLVAGLCLSMLAAGMLRFSGAQDTISTNSLSKLNDKPGTITLTGQVADEPDIRDTSQKLKIKIHDSLVLVTLGRYPQYRYLDTLRLTGELKSPPVFNDFNYRQFLQKDGIYSVMDYPKVALISQKPAYNIFTYAYEKILFCKEKLRQSIYNHFSGPQKLLLEGILLGDNSNMTQDLRDKLNTAGLRYLTAISGAHVIVVSELLMLLFLALGFWRGQAFYFSVIFIWLYIALTGFSASGIRAATMGSISLLAQHLGRQNTNARNITLAGALMLWQNPMLLAYDVGFQLSFLASLGIIYCKPLLEHFMTQFTKERAAYWVSMIAVTLTAQIFTLPIMVFNFGSISLVAPLTNILIMPMFYWLMVAGFLAALAGIFSNVMGFIFSIPCWFLLSYFLKVLDIFSRPWAQTAVSHIWWMWVVLYYLALAAAIAYCTKKLKPTFLGY